MSWQLDKQTKKYLFQRTFKTPQLAWQFLKQAMVVADKHHQQFTITLDNNRLQLTCQSNQQLLACDLGYDHDRVKDQPTRGILYCDGGSRGNPGPAATGYVLDNQHDQQIASGGQFLGQATNNQAEYQALIDGLQGALELDLAHLTIYLDSQLIVNQINGLYKIKNQSLKVYFRTVQDLLAQLVSWQVDHIPRRANQRADSLVNQILDQNS